MPPDQRTGEAQADKQQAADEHEQVVAPALVLQRPDARDDRRHAEHQQDIGNVGSHDVAEHDAVGVGEGGLDPDQQLRRRGAEGHDRQADDQCRHPQPQAKRHGPADQRITGAHEGG